MADKTRPTGMNSKWPLVLKIFNPFEEDGKLLLQGSNELLLCLWPYELCHMLSVEHQSRQWSSGCNVIICIWWNDGNHCLITPCHLCSTGSGPPRTPISWAAVTSASTSAPVTAISASALTVTSTMAEPKPVTRLTTIHWPQAGILSWRLSRYGAFSDILASCSELRYWQLEVIQKLCYVVGIEQHCNTMKFNMLFTLCCGGPIPVDRVCWS